MLFLPACAAGVGGWVVDVGPTPADISVRAVKRLVRLDRLLLAVQMAEAGRWRTDGHDEERIAGPVPSARKVSHTPFQFRLDFLPRRDGRLTHFRVSNDVNNKNESNYR